MELSLFHGQIVDHITHFSFSGSNTSFSSDFSNSFGDQYPMPECKQCGLYQDSIQANTAKRASVLVFQLRRLMNSHSRLAKKFSAIALS